MAATGIDAAIRELERDAERIQEAIRILKSVGNRGVGPSTPGRKKRGGRRKLSAAGRKRIAEAAKKRWAAFRAAQK
jgi:hypothetical protein